MVLLGDEAQVELDSVHFDIELILTQDRCTACAGHTTGSEIVLDARHLGAYGTFDARHLDDTGHIESRFGLFG
jgi:hypothetical protein